ncbi:glucocorticoid modulatory element-binding protein 1 [Chanos chanos]|uniref:Glucocorticoid modulatory element-binding protein 1 n=1 Tax=Chanos chanos TaxID=29144 RepID=A0A6J2WHU6_CHACN|nr:glucocorticoid modulatory element-binding protein 1-like [Chanos chanos]
MANVDVSMSMGDMMVVKTVEREEVGEPDDSGKTQVILELQPITAGTEDETGEADTTVIDVETPEEVHAEGEDVEIGYPITCGESKAILLFKKFVCPGINVKCVKYEDQLISPKQFVHMSGKATLKDWKRAIRMGGVMLRKMMDSGQLDFYQHSSLCTNTCRSTKFDLLINNTRFPPDGTGLTATTPTSSQGQVVIGNGGPVTVVEDKPEEVTGMSEWSSVTVSTVEKKVGQEISEETLNFWKGIADVGLLGEVVSNIRTELLEMLRGVQHRSDQASLQDAEVAVLSNLAQVFGLLDSVKRVLTERRKQTDPGEEQVLSRLTSLEQQLEAQRKQQARHWLSQAQSANTVTLPTPPPAKRSAKRPRLQRPASTTLLSAPGATAAAAQPLTLTPQQFTMLSPITLTSVGQPFAVAGLAPPSNTVTLHTLPAGSQLFTRLTAASTAMDAKGETITLHPASGLTLLGTATVQDPGQLGTVVSPMELVQLTQGSAAAVAQDGEVVAGTVLVQEGVVDVEGTEDENQAHTTTVIEIDPAPGEQNMGLMELQLAGEPTGGVEGGEETTTVMLQGQVEDSEEVHLAANEQLHHLQIMVVEESSPGENNAK